MEMLRPLSYLVPGAIVAALALRAGLGLRKTFAGLRAKAAEQSREVPPLATAYFQNTLRVLLVTGGLFLLLAGADAVTYRITPDLLLSRALGYSSGVVLLIGSFALMLHSGVDRQLKFMDLFSRRAYLIVGVWGMIAAAWGMMQVTLHGGVWA